MDIRIIYSDDAASMTEKLISSYGLEGKIGRKDSRIILKPNFVVPSPADNGATTHIEIITTLIGYLQKHGFENITVAEGAWVGASTSDAFSKTGLYDICRKYGVRILDLKKDSYRKPIAALNAIVKPDLNIVDSICGDLDFEEGGNPVRTDRMYLGENAVLTDAFGANLMGFRPEDIEYIPIAASYGIGSMNIDDINLIELNKPSASSAKPHGAVARLASYTAPDMACSACYASLIHALKRMDDNGSIRKLKGMKIACGQGYRGKSPDIGTGICCKDARISVKGCPPSAADILRTLEEL